MQVSSDPKYDTDIVNLRYLNKAIAISEKENDDKIEQLTKNYGSQPSPPYSIGDTYVVGRKIYKCIKSRSIGSFNMSDWQLIVDGEEVKKFIDGVYTLDKIDITNQLDNKIETYIQDEDPSLSWTTDIEKEKHKGDYWRKRSSNGHREYCYTKLSTNPISYKWIETDAPAPIYDMIDGKKSIYTVKPNSYNKDDMWIIEDSVLSEELPDGVKHGDWVFALQNSDNYDKTHWVKKDENINIEYLEKNYYQITEIDNKFTEIDRDIDSKITQAKDDISLSVSQLYTTKEETTSIINRVSNVEEDIGTITETTTTQGELLSQLSVSTGEIKQVVSETVKKQTALEVNLNGTNENVSKIKNQLEKETEETIKKLTQITLDIDSIEESVSKFTNQSETISKLEIDIESIKSSIGNITDTTTSSQGIGIVEMEKVMNSEILYLQIYPTSTDLSLLYPSDDLYPSDNLYPTCRDLIFQSDTDTYIFTLPCDLLYLNNNIKDEFILNHETKEMYKIQRVEIDSNGNKYALIEPQTQYFVYQPFVIEKNGDYKIKMLSFDDSYIYVRTLAQNLLTSQYATKVELNSAIELTKQNIKQEVNGEIALIDGTVKDLSASLELKLNTNDLLSEIALKSNLLTIDADNLKLSANGFMECFGAKINGEFAQYADNQLLSVEIKNNELRVYDWEDNGDFSGAISSIHSDGTGRHGVCLYCGSNNDVCLGYKTNENSSHIDYVFNFNTADLNNTPWIKNTSSGKIFQNNPGGGIIIENGFIKNWGLNLATGTINISNIVINVVDGLIVSWEVY